MIKKQGCQPCSQFEPDARRIAEENEVGFKTVMRESMPEEMQPEFYPYFYLMHEGKAIEHWGGTSDRKYERVIQRHLKK